MGSDNDRMAFLWVIGTQFKLKFYKIAYTNNPNDISVNIKLLKIVKKTHKTTHKIDYHLNPFSGGSN